MSLSCECCVLSVRGLCDWPIPPSEESYRACVFVSVYYLETSTLRQPRPEYGCCATGGKNCNLCGLKVIERLVVHFFDSGPRTFLRTMLSTQFHTYK